MTTTETQRTFELIARAGKLRELFAIPKKSPALLRAEQDRRDARAARQAVRDESLREIHNYADAAQKNPLQARRIVALEADLVTHAAAVDAADAKLKDARAKYSRVFASELSAPAIEAAATLGAMVETLDELVGAIADCRNFAEANALESPPMIRRSRGMQALCFELRKSLRE